jgi:thiol-disulfide isomerase/thioredoxin
MRVIFLCITIFIFFNASGQSIKKYKVEQLVERINKAGDTVLIVNFWATWCKPCIEELPYFHALAGKYKDQKIKLLLVSLDFPKDYPEGIAAFAKKEGYDSEIVFLDETDADLFCPQIDKSWSGAIPSTFIASSAKGYRKFTEGKMKAAELEILILQAVGK